MQGDADRPPGESRENAVVREIFEETGIVVPVENVSYFKELYVRYPEYDFVYHIFSSKINAKNIDKIRLNEEEHKSSNWVFPKDALKMRLIPDEDYCIKLFYNIK